MSSYRSTLENLFGVRFIAIGVPVEQIDKSLKPGDLEFVARTKDAYVYENPRALPRVMLAADWRKADFGAMIRDGGWPDVDPRRTVLLESAPAGAPNGGAGGTARIVRYHNTEIVIEADAPAGGYARAQRRLASVVAGERRRQAGWKSSRPMCCSAPSWCRPASTPCASASIRSRAHSPS